MNFYIGQNGISIGSAIFAGLKNVTNKQTNKQTNTDRPRHSVWPLSLANSYLRNDIYSKHLPFIFAVLLLRYSARSGAV